MGFKLSIILGLLLVASLTGSAAYIRYLHTQMAVLKGNQIVLETQIEDQNNSIDTYLKKQEQIGFQLNSLEAEKNSALREFNSLRDKFAKHDMNSLTLAKPKLIESRVNNGTKKLKESLIKLTDSTQFDPKTEASDVPQPVLTPSESKSRAPQSPEIEVKNAENSIRG